MTSAVLDKPTQESTTATEHARDELVEMIERGWGNTPQPQIPPDWRDKPGPAIMHFRKW